MTPKPPGAVIVTTAIVDGRPYSIEVLEDAETVAALLNRAERRQPRD